MARLEGTTDLTVAQDVDNIGGGGDLRVVRNQQDGRAKFAVETREGGTKLGGGGRIQVASGLVGQDDVRVHREGPGDGGALGLTAGEAVGGLVAAMRQPHQTQERLHPLGGDIAAIEERGQCDILCDGEGRNEVTILKDDATESGGSNPARRFRSVLLPAPEGPMTA